MKEDQSRHWVILCDPWPIWHTSELTHDPRDPRPMTYELWLLHTCCINSRHLYPVYTIQPVVNPVVQPVWQSAVSCKQTSNRLSRGCQTGLTTGLKIVLNEQPLFVQPVVKPGWTTGLTTGCIHDTAGCQTGCLVKRVWQPVECLYTRYNRLSNLTIGCIM